MPAQWGFAGKRLRGSMTAATKAGRAQRVLVLVGTRPEAINLASLVDALRNQPDVVTASVSSGQHPRMVASTLEHLGVATDLELAPLDYKPFVQLIATARLVITDSGGTQEEAPYVGVPVPVVRDATERPEAFAYGGLRLVPPMRNAVLAPAEAALAATRHAPVQFDASAPFGDGHSGGRIAGMLASVESGRLPLRQGVR